MASSTRQDLERMTSLKAKNSSRTGQVFKRGLSRMTSVTMDSYLPTIISERRMKIDPAAAMLREYAQTGKVLTKTGLK